MTTINLKLYSFNELPKAAQERAIQEHRDFLLSVLQPDYIDGITDWNDAEKMEMYRDEYDYMENNDEPIIENIEINDYLYFYDGTLCQAVTYTAGPLTGQTWVTIHGERYQGQEAAL